MSWLGWSLVIFLTALVTLLGTAWLTGRQPRVPLDRLADPRPLPGELNPYCPDCIPGCNISHAGYLRPELPTAGYFDLPGTLARFTAPDGPYGPWPVDTGPLLILSEKDAANVELEIYTQDLIAEAEAKIPPRWR